jgi:hypothetical protein
MVFVEIDKTFYDISGNPHQGYYLDDLIYTNFVKVVIPSVKNRWDYPFIVSGMEGTGKSTLAFTFAHFLDPTFNLDRVVFSADGLMKAIDNAKPESAIVMDEAIISLASQSASTAIQQILIKKFVTIRKKRLYIFLVIPSIFLLRKYFAIFRAKILIHCFTPDGISRGMAKIFSYETKRKLYLLGQKMFDQGAVREDFVIHFVDTENYFFDANEYDQKKEAAIKQITDSMDERKVLTPQNIQTIAERDVLMLTLFNLYKYTKDMLARFTEKEMPTNYNLDIAPKDFVKFLKEKASINITTAGLAKSIDRSLLYLEQKEIAKDKKKKLLAEMEIRG